MKRNNICISKWKEDSTHRSQRDIGRYWNVVCEMHGSVKSFLEFSLVVRNYTYLKTYWTYMSEGGYSRVLSGDGGDAWGSP